MNIYCFCWSIDNVAFFHVVSHNLEFGIENVKRIFKEEGIEEYQKSESDSVLELVFKDQNGSFFSGYFWKIPALYGDKLPEETFEANNFQLMMDFYQELKGKIKAEKLNLKVGVKKGITVWMTE